MPDTRRSCATALLLSWAFLLGCTPLPPVKDPRPFGAPTPDVNGLTEAQREAYYHQDEGIQYLPLDVFLSLSRPVMPPQGASILRLFKVYEERLLEHPERLGLYPDPYPGAEAPIGISISRDRDYVAMGGINCATCHTSVWTVRGGDGREVIVDGGSSLFAIDRFVQEMLFSLIGTVANPVEMVAFNARYDARVAQRVRAGGPIGAHALTGTPLTAQERAAHDAELKDVFEKSPEYAALRQALAAETADATRLAPVVNGLGAALEARAQKLPRPAIGPLTAPHKTTLTGGAYPSADELNSGFRMFVYLVKRVSHFVSVAGYAGTAPSATPSGLGRSNPWAVTGNMLTSAYLQQPQSQWPSFTNAPINTPHLWGFEENRWVFWSGVTNSMLERNLAQGIALLTDFNWDKSSYETTVSVRKLEAISALARQIKPPAWPALFGAIDPARAARGKALFEGKACGCLGCHAAKDPTPGPGAALVSYLDVGTDPNYVQGQRKLLAGQGIFPILADWLGTVKKNAYTREDVSAADQAVFEVGRTPSYWRGPTSAPDGAPWSGIEARSLRGIWASPPYLHNGAVPSIRQLLNKPADRTRTFFVGDPEYDTRDLGITSREFSYTGYEGLAMIDTRLDGNSSGGHDYCTALGDDEKDALIEFLKTY